MKGESSELSAVYRSHLFTSGVWNKGYIKGITYIIHADSPLLQGGKWKEHVWAKDLMEAYGILHATARL